MDSCKSSLYQVIDPSMYAETLYGSRHGSTQPEASRQSFGEHTSTCGFRREYTYKPPPGALQNNFESWVLDGPSCDSPLSTCSSQSPSEGIATPPTYTCQLPLPGYDLHNHHNQLCQDNATGYADYRNVTMVPWASQFTVPSNWTAHSMQNWFTDGYHTGLQLPVTEPFVPLQNITAPELLLPSQSFPAPDHFDVYNTPDPTKEDDSMDDTASESEESNDDDYGESGGSTDGRTSKSRSHALMPRFMLSKWDLSGMSSYNRQQSHSFYCPLRGQTDTRGKICNAKFARPEHCRRHVKTVHGDVKEYRCKVQGCERAFSRGDNLRDHYWTHLQRGGRIGKNDKMSLAELKEILGRSEKKLIRKLKQKMAKHKAKQLRAAVKTTI
ncbi:hypothetical protein IAQ61_005339 [Plenodomus lingam]|uniref:C2H2-type domain-containing protein n=1 Tax=Leptosphaeria maculans (strain JN3 / isolate v23.1.3 / race Av1-4-5-6-7-8) TaxID=985895 RepID=E4ZS16_LEPMJ|nr:hypothetical protein LEMA_P123480.1 [Plenodomus lingam JN3]KAH9872503.1 hypothetical protein IAQ61_005339 [Plenodomus lingam]CBX94196.1 hypothetical protein LEMA_P123480.1 [Plenodomus lingam JN3]